MTASYARCLPMLLAACLLASCAQLKSEAPERKVFFTNITDGEKVESPFTVRVGAQGLTVEAMGSLKSNAGHHHVLIDVDVPKKGDVIPSDDKHVHLDGGEDKVKLTLKPGKHKLVLQFADGYHRAMGRELSATIQVTVEEGESGDGDGDGDTGDGDTGDGDTGDGDVTPPDGDVTPPGDGDGDGTCAGVPEWSSVKASVNAGDKVQNKGSQYQCKSDGFMAYCRVDSYEPGGPNESAWMLAWSLLGTCN
jgi:hypothetical protein